MKKHWWKVLTVILLFYVLLAGLLIPLGVGIYKVSPVSLNAGQAVDLKVYAYNAVYDNTENIDARIRINPNEAICASEINTISSNSLSIKFNIPYGKLPIEVVDKTGKKSPFPLLEIYEPQNGYTSLESAVFIKQAAAPNGDSTSLDLCKAEAFPADTNTNFPFLNILEETIRNLFFHVPMWFGMMLILLLSVISSIRMLQQPDRIEHDIKASSFATIGVLFGILGIITGALWAKNTWGAYWSWDVKQNTSAVALLIYLAYFVLRSSFDDIDKRARISAIYNVFAFATLIPLLYVVPRMADSLHPGMGGNPAFSSYDLDSTMRLVFYPAVIGWTLLGFWLATLLTRIERIRQKKLSLY
ncbi:MAG: cytochrome c biogenesis protein CcsA [Aureispira sp.]|nr:cytochrome c biogenesis protein CcsA [Aureispira sp.]